MWRDGRDGCVDMPMHACKVDGRFPRRDAHDAAAAQQMRPSRRREQRLGWHAAGVQALAAHAVPLDQGDPQPEPGRAARRGQPGRASTDDDQVVRPLLRRLCTLAQLGCAK